MTWEYCLFSMEDKLGGKDWLHFSHEQCADTLSSFPGVAKGPQEVHLKLSGLPLGGPGGKEMEVLRALGDADWELAFSYASGMSGGRWHRWVFKRTRRQPAALTLPAESD